MALFSKGGVSLSEAVSKNVNLSDMYALLGCFEIGFALFQRVSLEDFDESVS